MMLKTSIRRQSLVLALLLLGLTPFAPAQTRRALLSIDSLNLAPDQYVASLRISTWGVSVLSACKVPLSWKFEVEKLQDAEGLLSARSDVHGERLKELGNMFLVEVTASSGGAATPGAPASFSGSLTLAHIDSDERRSHRKLKPENFRLTEAQSCPAPAVATR